MTEPASASQMDGHVAGGGGLMAMLSSLQTELDSLHRSIAEQEARAAELDARDAALREHAAALSEREFHLAERHRELNAAQETLLAEASAWKERERAAGVGESAWYVSRRARLKKQRVLLAERAEQLLRAKRMIESRLSDTGRTRSSLPVAGGAKPAGGSRSVSVSPRSGGRGFAGAMMLSALAFGLIGGVSWGVSGVLDSPRYTARAAIEIEASAEPRDAEAVDSWSGFHEELAQDPQLMEEVAQRLRRRGYVEFATPADLRRAFEADLCVERGSPGRLEFTFTGEGRERSAGVLSAMVSTLVSMANDSRERRADQAATVVASASRCGEEAVETRRVPMFLATAGALSGLAVCAGLIGVKMSERGRPGRPGHQVEPDEAWAVG